MKLTQLIFTLIAALTFTFASFAPPSNAFSDSTRRARASCVEVPGARNETRRYSVLLAGNRIGERTIESLGPRELRYTLSYQDRGRGPDLSTVLHVDQRGIPLQMHTTGVDYFKNPVDDRFETDGETVSWTNTNESGSAPAGGFYVGFEEAEGLEPLVRALLCDEDRTLELFPGGTARMHHVRDHVLVRGEETVKLGLYAIEGMSFSPSYAWIDDSNTLFAAGWSIRKGWETFQPELEQIQTERAAQRLGEIARSLKRSQGEPLHIRNARVFDSRTRTADGLKDVWIADGRIVAIGTELAVPPRAMVVDAQGGFLMPGLWDMHVHNFDGDGTGLEHLANGVTTIRDLASDPDALLELRNRWHSGVTLGPRVVMAGFMDGPGEFAAPTQVLVDNEAEAREAVEEYAALGYEQIKVYNSLRKELLPTIIATARQHGMRVSGHIPLHMLAEEAVKQGYNEIQHINHLFLNFMDRSIDNRTPARFTEVAKHGAELELGSAPVRAFIELLAKNDVAVDPTLALFEADWVARPGEIMQPMRPYTEQIPPVVRRTSLWAGLPIPEGMDDRYKESFQRATEFVKALHDAGVVILPGTDFMPGFALHRELELYAEAGIPNRDVLYLATTGAATTMRHEDSGSIEPGRRADLIIIDGDPLSRISDIRRIEWVIRDGYLYRASDIRRALGMRVQ